jgi:Ca-activated chloride channel family protein
MTLLGLSLTQLALLFGVVGAAVTALYILKLRRRRVRVPFAKLWDRVLKERESTSLFRRLKRLLSLLLQLLFLLLLTAALGDPRLSAEVLDGRHIILLLDASASMKAIDEKAGTRAQAALEQAKSIVRGMNGADALMLVRMDAQVTPLTGFETDEKALIKALEGVTPSDTRADLLRALKFCGDALRGQKNPLLILVSDGAFPKEHSRLVLLDDRSGKRARPPPGAKKTKKVKKPKGKAGQPVGPRLAEVDLRGITVRHLPVGQSRDNIGIVAFNARRYVRNKRSFELFLEVVNYRKQAAQADLQLYADGVLVDVQRLKLAPQKTERYTCDPNDPRRSKKAWCELAASGELLEARLVAPKSTAGKPVALDAFPLDDRAHALLPRREKQRVLLVTEGNLFLEGVMLLEPNLDLSRIRPARYSNAMARRFDAVIFDGHYPEQAPDRHALVINPPDHGGPFEVTGRIRAPLITDQSRKHPVMRWVTLKDVNIASSARFARAPKVAVLAASFKEPIMVAKNVDGIKTVAFGFDITKSDLPLRVAFPILVLNALDWFAGDSEGLVTSYRTGETWPVPVQLAGPSPEVKVTGPDGRVFSVPVDNGRALIHGIQVGVYTLEAGAETTRLAANLADPLESDIVPGRSLVLGGRVLEQPTGFGIALRREIWIYLLLAAVLLTIVEWLTYNRRVTV